MRLGACLLLAGTVFFSVTNQAKACDCPMPRPEEDVMVLEQFEIAGEFKVKSVRFPDYTKNAKDEYGRIVLHVKDLYKGSLSGAREGKHGDITVRHEMVSDCSRGLGEGKVYPLLLKKDEEGYLLPDQCTDLSPEGWDKLKHETPL